MQKKNKKKTTFDHWIIFPFFRMIKVFEKKTYKFCTNIFHLPQICIVYFCWLLSHNFQSFSLDSTTTKYKDRLTQYKNKSKYRKNYITHCLPQFWLSATKQQQQLCGNKICTSICNWYFPDIYRKFITKHQIFCESIILFVVKFVNLRQAAK